MFPDFLWYRHLRPVCAPHGFLISPKGVTLNGTSWILQIIVFYYDLNHGINLNTYKNKYAIGERGI